jgi:hypothetical protein
MNRIERFGLCVLSANAFAIDITATVPDPSSSAPFQILSGPAANGFIPTWS